MMLYCIIGFNVFPPAEAISGAFAQDKWEIYTKLQDIMNPSFKIDRPTGCNLMDDTTAEELYKYGNLLINSIKSCN